MQQLLIRVWSALLICHTVAACIAIPVKAPPGEKPFEAHVSSFIVEGKTTREQVSERLAQAEPERFGKDTVWVYTESRDTWQWLVCAGGGYVADCGIFGTSREYFLTLTFDSAGIVRAWETSSTLWECSPIGVCKSSSLIMAYATEEQDRRVKAISPENDCTLFVYATLPGGGNAVVWVDEQLLGWFVNSNGYLMRRVGPGLHRVTTRHSNYSAREARLGRNTQWLNINCVPGERYFVHHVARHKDRGKRRFLLITESEGHEHVQARKLILTPDENGEVPLATQSWGAPKSGSSLDDVTWHVQFKLRQLGIYDGALDGQLTPETEAAIAAFKKRNRIYGETLLDDPTLTALGFYDR